MSLYVLAGSTMNAVAVAGSSSVTLSPTAETDFPAANLCDGRSNLPTVWSAGTSEYIASVDLSASPPTIDFCSVHGHNWAAMTPYLESSTNGSSWTTRATMTPQRDSFYSVLSSGISARYWRLRITGSPATAPYVGEWVLGQAMEMTRPQYGGQIELLHAQSRNVGAAGMQWVYSRGAATRRHLTLDFIHDSSTDYEQTRDDFYRASRGGLYPCVVAPADLETGLVVLGRIKERIAFKKETLYLRTSSWEVTEDAMPAMEWRQAAAARVAFAMGDVPAATSEYTASGGMAFGGSASPAVMVTVGGSYLTLESGDQISTEDGGGGLILESSTSS